MEKSELIGLIQKAANGDVQAFAVLYEAYYNQIYYLCFKLIQNRDDASDIAQETFASAFENLRKLNNAFVFESWLKTIAANKCKNFFKKYKPVLFSQYDKSDDIEFVIEDSKAENAEDTFDDFETRRIINQIIDNLPDEQRICIILYYYDEKSVTEIAQFLECSNGTVKSRLNYARKKIHDEIERIEKENNIQLHSATAIPLLGTIISKQVPKALEHPDFTSIMKNAAEIPIKISEPQFTESQSAERKVTETQDVEPVKDTNSISESVSSSAKSTLAKKVIKTTVTKIVAGTMGAVILVTGGAFAGSKLAANNSKPTPETTVSTTENTTEEVPETTTQLALEQIENIQVDGADFYDETDNNGVPFSGGFAVKISFDPVEHAQGYRLRYNYSYTESIYQDFDAEHTKFWYGGQAGPDSIDACAFTTDENGEKIYSDWVNLFNWEQNDIWGGNNNVPTYSTERLDDFTDGYLEIDPSTLLMEQQNE